MSWKLNSHFTVDTFLKAKAKLDDSDGEIIKSSI